MSEFVSPLAVRTDSNRFVDDRVDDSTGLRILKRLIQRDWDFWSGFKPVDCLTVLAFYKWTNFMLRRLKNYLPTATPSGTCAGGTTQRPALAIFALISFFSFYYRCKTLEGLHNNKSKAAKLFKYWGQTPTVFVEQTSIENRINALTNQLYLE